MILLVNCKVQKKSSGGYKVLLNGVDIAPYVTDFNLNVALGHTPFITVDIPVESFDCDELFELIANNGAPEKRGSP